MRGCWIEGYASLLASDSSSSPSKHDSCFRIRKPSRLQAYTAEMEMTSLAGFSHGIHSLIYSPILSLILLLDSLAD